MMISTKGRYALRVMIDLAEHETDGYIPLTEIAERQGISEKYLESILAVLSKAGILDALRGKHGGYRLSRPAASYCAYEILRLTEGSLAPVQCVDNSIECDQTDTCRTFWLWKGLDEAIETYLRQFTLADIVAGGKLPRE